MEPVVESVACPAVIAASSSATTLAHADTPEIIVDNEKALTINNFELSLSDSERSGRATVPHHIFSTQTQIIASGYFISQMPSHTLLPLSNSTTARLSKDVPRIIRSVRKHNKAPTADQSVDFGMSALSAVSSSFKFATGTDTSTEKVGLEVSAISANYQDQMEEK
jgi:hypothetical protein